MQVSIRWLLLIMIMVGFGIAFNMHSSISGDIKQIPIANTNDTWQNASRMYGWPLSIFELNRQSQFSVVGKNQNGGNVLAIARYTRQIKPVAVVLNVLVAALSVLSVYVVLLTACRVLAKRLVRGARGDHDCHVSK